MNLSNIQSDVQQIVVYRDRLIQTLQALRGQAMEVDDLPLNKAARRALMAKLIVAEGEMVDVLKGINACLEVKS